MKISRPLSFSRFLSSLAFLTCSLRSPTTKRGKKGNRRRTKKKGTQISAVLCFVVFARFSSSLHQLFSSVVDPLSVQGKQKKERKGKKRRPAIVANCAVSSLPSLAQASTNSRAFSKDSPLIRNPSFALTHKIHGCRAFETLAANRDLRICSGPAWLSLLFQIGIYSGCNS